MSILVTGGAGYIGSHTSVLLLNAGYDIVIADNFSNSSEETIARITELGGRAPAVEHVDLCDMAALDAVFARYPIDAVIHFAGLKAVGESVAQPLFYYGNNIVSTINLCKCMEKYDVHQLVFSSSATVYGMPETVPLREDAPLHTLNPYGATKLVIENMLRDVSASNADWRIALLRYFNPIGAHESGLIGEAPNGIPNNLMPYITQVASGVRAELSVFGSDYPTADGTCIRDYIHVMDLAQGHLQALKKLPTINGIDAYNLGTGTGYSVLDVIHTFEEATGVTIPYRIAPRRPGDAPVSYADPTKAHTELDWKAERGLHDMCKDAWRFQLQKEDH
ncbi:UDP-glucose 4-epimerase GalE [Shouchella lonarensis]|uniref:UDP-glucose 4-epimerase n=1 Tax=Shouchella lonarensis TaxID=1464122 RepID=A0A1G6GXN7_9BACI|nr:UDP-glucose 4-epimerase GalE [Shouchella lonarensis]SDB86820.1 UDP-galactose 4-epimerase [Shouchella lonarensis]